MTERCPMSLRVNHSTATAGSVGDFLATRYALPGPLGCFVAAAITASRCWMRTGSATFCAVVPPNAGRRRRRLGNRVLDLSGQRRRRGWPLHARLSRDDARNIPQRIPGRPRVDVVEELPVDHGQARLGRRDPWGAADRPMRGPTRHLRASMLSGVGRERSAGDQHEQGCGRNAVQ
jgi:hypothetical protein